MRRILILFLLLCAWAPVQAAPYDGLQVVGMGENFTDDQQAQLQMMGFLTKYKEHVVGMYFRRGSTEIHYYMNVADWDKMKQLLIKSRDEWQTLQVRDFDSLGAIPGYRVANQVANVRFSLMGATNLATKQLLINANGGMTSPQRVSIHLGLKQVKVLVEEFSKVDNWFRMGATPTPAP